jgi:hypothetical protein
MFNISEARQKELTEHFTKIFSDEDRRYDWSYKKRGICGPYDRNWGGYVTIEQFPASCGNYELCCVSDSSLPTFCKNAAERAFWLKMLIDEFTKCDYGCLFVSVPASTKTGRTMRPYTKIAKAMELLGIKHISRAKNWNHPTHFSDVFCLVGGGK